MAIHTVKTTQIIWTQMISFTTHTFETTKAHVRYQMQHHSFGKKVFPLHHGIMENYPTSGVHL